MPSRTVLITGCSQGGIGDALCKEFSHQGLRVFATARNPAKIEHFQALGIETVLLDVTDTASLEKAVRSALLPGVPWTFLSTTPGYSMPLLDANIDIARDMFNVNVFAMVSVVQAFAPLLMASKGTVVNIASIAGKGPFPFQGFYNASKTAVNLLTDNLRVELEPLGVKVILVVTGTVRTRFFENLPASRIPEQSVYAPARKEVEYIMPGSVAQQSAIGVDKYAQTVVMNALKRRPTVHHWVGGSVTGVWAVTSFLWHTAWDFILPIYYQMSQISTTLKRCQNTNLEQIG